MGITVLKNNAPWGPFTRVQIEEGLKRGDFTLQYLAHAPGQNEWLPLGEVLHALDVKSALPPIPAPRELPPVPVSEVHPAAPDVPGPPPLLPPLVNDGTEKPMPPAPPVLPEGDAVEVRLPTAPFIPRFIAFLIDCAILFVPLLTLFALRAMTLEVQGAWDHIDHESRMQEWALLHRDFERLLLLVAIGLGWLYSAGLECSRWQATVGKQWMGIKVTDAQGERLDFLQATQRYAAKYLSALPCFLGFIVALFSARGLALHDRLAGTRVIRC